MLLKFLISPLSIIVTILLIAGTIYAMYILSKYLKDETKSNLYNNLEQLHRKTEDIEEGIVKKSAEYQVEYQKEVSRRDEKKRRRKKRR